MCCRGSEKRTFLEGGLVVGLVALAEVSGMCMCCRGRENRTVREGRVEKGSDVLEKGIGSFIGC